MSRTERKVQDLIEDDPSMEDAIAVVKTHIENNGGGVEWGDVSDDLTSGQWGRMIEKGIVVDDDDGGFELRNPDAVESALSADTETAAEIELDIDDDEEIEAEGWSTYDKLAGVGVLAVMAGYYYPPIKNAVGGALGLFLKPIDAMLPFYAVVLVLAMLTGAYSSILQAKLMNTELIQRQQERMKALKERKEEAKERGDDAELDRIKDKEMDMMSDQMGMFKEQFRPMVWVMLFTIPIFLWIYFTVLPGSVGESHIAGTEFMVQTSEGAQPGMVLPMVGEVSWSGGVLGPIQTWIAWYFVCSMGFSQLIRKAINLQTPTAS